MPIVRIDLADSRPPAQQRAISDGVHRAFTRSVGIPEGDRFHIISPHPAYELIADPDYLGVSRQDVVYIQITLVAGRSVDVKRSLYQAVVEELTAVGVRPEDVAIVLTENTRADFSFGNGEAQVVALGPLAGTTPTV